MWKVALKNLYKQRGRTFLALVGLAMGIGAVVSLVAIADGIRASVGDVLGKMQAITVIEEGAMMEMFSNIPISYVEEMEALPFVKVAVPEVIDTVRTIDGETTGMMVSMNYIGIIGIDPERVMRLQGGLDGFYGGQLVNGRFLNANDKYSLVIGKKISEDYKKNVGSNINLDGQDFKVVGVFTTGTDMMDQNILMPLEVAQELVGREKDTVNLLYVVPTDLTQVEKYANIIELRFDGMEAMSAQEASSEVSGLLSTIDIFFWLISMVAAVIGAVGITNTMLMSVMERQDEFGLLRAVGWTKKDVIKLVLEESILLGIVGGTIGLALGLAVSQIAGSLAGLTMHITFELVATAFLFAVIFGTVGGVYPAYQATTVSPMEALRYG